MTTNSFSSPERPSGRPGAVLRIISREALGAFSAWQPPSLCEPGEPASQGSERGAGAASAAASAAYRQGLADGRAAALLQARQGAEQAFADGLAALLGEFGAQLETHESRFADSLACTATQLARQVLRCELAVRPEIVASVAREALGCLLPGARRIAVRVHPLDADFVLRAAAGELEHLEARVVCDPAVARGGCVVDSDLGSVDAGIELRWLHAAAALTAQAQTLAYE